MENGEKFINRYEHENFLRKKICELQRTIEFYKRDIEFEEHHLSFCRNAFERCRTEEKLRNYRKQLESAENELAHLKEEIKPLQYPNSLVNVKRIRKTPIYKVPDSRLFSVRGDCAFRYDRDTFACELRNFGFGFSDASFGKIMNLDLNQDEQQMVRDLLDGKSVEISDCTFVVYAGKMCIRDEEEAMAIFYDTFHFLNVIQRDYLARSYLKLSISEIYRPDAVEIFRGEDGDDCDVIQFHFSMKVDGPKDIPLVKWCNLTTPLRFFPGKWDSEAFAMKARLAYGDKIDVSPKNFIMQKPDAYEDLERAFYYEYSFGIRSGGKFLCQAETLDEVVFQGEFHYYAAEFGSGVSNLKLSNNFSTCEGYIKCLEGLIEMIDEAIAVVEGFSSEPIVYQTSPDKKFGHISFFVHNSDDAYRVLQDLGVKRKRAQMVIANVRRLLIPLEEETGLLWDGRRDVIRVACHYLFQEISLNPLLYLNSFDSTVRKYAHLLVTG